MNSPGIEILKKTLRIPQAAFGVLILTVTVFVAISAPLIVPEDPEEMDFDNLLQGISTEHLLGSDQMGRDTLSRLIYGARVARMVSLGAGGIGVAIGVPPARVAV